MPSFAIFHSLCDSPTGGGKAKEVDLKIFTLEKEHSFKIKLKRQEQDCVVY